MVWFMQAGGFPMVFILLFGLIAFINAGLLWRAPDQRRLEFIRQMSRATLYSVGAGVAADLAAVFIKVPGNSAWARSPNLHLIVMEGLGESMTPCILGFTLLSLTAFLTAFAVRRMPREL